MASMSSDRKLRDFLLAQSPAWLAERLLNWAVATSTFVPASFVGDPPTHVACGRVASP